MERQQVYHEERNERCVFRSSETDLEFRAGRERQYWRLRLWRCPEMNVLFDKHLVYRPAEWQVCLPRCRSSRRRFRCGLDFRPASLCWRLQLRFRQSGGEKDDAKRRQWCRWMRGLFKLQEFGLFVTSCHGHRLLGLKPRNACSTFIGELRQSRVLLNFCGIDPRSIDWKMGDRCPGQGWMRRRADSACIWPPFGTHRGRCALH